MIWVNQIIQGVLLGGYYALIACGLSFRYGVMGINNLAHGSLAVLAAFALFVLADRYAIPPFAGLLIVLPAMAVIGWLLNRGMLGRSLRGGLLLPILSTFGLSIVIDNLPSPPPLRWWRSASPARSSRCARRSTRMPARRN